MPISFLQNKKNCNNLFHWKTVLFIFVNLLASLKHNGIRVEYYGVYLQRRTKKTDFRWMHEGNHFNIKTCLFSSFSQRFWFQGLQDQIFLDWPWLGNMLGIKPNIPFCLSSPSNDLQLHIMWPLFELSL